MRLSQRIVEFLYPPWRVPPHFRRYPVFIRRARTVVVFSPKVACSHVVLWAFNHEGLLEAAERRDVLPHGYRLHVYAQSRAFRSQLRQVISRSGNGFTLLKVTRAPTNRLVSIFRHACRFPFLREPVRDALGFDVAHRGLSLADLDTVLGTLSLTAPTPSDPHVRTQYHPLWDLDFDRVVTLNLDEVPLNAGLNAFERDLGLPPTDFAAIPAFDRLREAHYATAAAFRGRDAIETHRFKRRDASHFPVGALLAAPLLADMARRHYAIDQDWIASGDTAGRLFQHGEETFGPRVVAHGSP